VSAQLAASQEGLSSVSISFIHSCLRANDVSTHSRPAVTCKLTPESLLSATVWYDLSTEIQFLLKKSTEVTNELKHFSKLHTFVKINLKATTNITRKSESGGNLKLTCTCGPAPVEIKLAHVEAGL
jgi:hypothetical protein